MARWRDYVPENPPKLGDIGDEIIDLTIHCPNPECGRVVRFTPAELIERHGRDAVAYRVAERHVCKVCNWRGTPEWRWKPHKPQGPGVRFQNAWDAGLKRQAGHPDDKS